MFSKLAEPHSGKIIENVLKKEEDFAELKSKTLSMKSLTLSESQVSDVEMILSGAFSPLNGFFTKKELLSVAKNSQLSDGTFWPIPTYLSADENFVSDLNKPDQIVLRDSEGFPIAVMEIEDIFHYTPKEEIRDFYGDFSGESLPNYISSRSPVLIGGRIKGLMHPKHFDFRRLRFLPNELRNHFWRLGWKNILNCQTSVPLHKPKVESMIRSARQLNCNIVISPITGYSEEPEIEYYSLVRSIEKLITNVDEIKTVQMMPYSPRPAGLRDLQMRLILAKNYGMNHLYIDWNALEYLKNGGASTDIEHLKNKIKKTSEQLEIKTVYGKEMVWVEEVAKFFPVDSIPEDMTSKKFNEKELNRRLEWEEKIPDWYSWPDVLKEVSLAKPPLSKKGFTVFFTGLSGAGKSTIAKGLTAKLKQIGSRPVTLLDGDIVRLNLSSKLGFSKEDRSINVRRIGFVASEITKNGGVAVCAPIAPYIEDRMANRKLVSRYGGYIEVFVNTPIETCEKRDVKGLYAKARKGLIKDFTGIDDPYEIPENPEIIVNTADSDPETLVEEVLFRIKQMGYL